MESNKIKAKEITKTLYVNSVELGYKSNADLKIVLPKNFPKVKKISLEVLNGN